MSQEKDRRDFYRVVTASIAISFAIMAAVVQSARPERDYTFDFSIWTVIAFFVGGVLGWLLSWGCFRLTDRGRRN